MQFYSFNSYRTQSLLRVEREIVELIDRNQKGAKIMEISTVLLLLALFFGVITVLVIFLKS